MFLKEKIFYTSNQVYEPAEDTFLLAENLEVKNGESVLEVGPGCGLLSVIAASEASKVTSIDINPWACRLTILNAKVNGVSHKIDVICADLSGPIRGNTLFDLILFNAPYLPDDESEGKSWIDYAWSGGNNGRAVIDRFLMSVSNLLNRGGRLLLVQSTLAGVEETIKRLVGYNLKADIIAEKKCDFERIVVIEAVKQNTAEN